MLKKISSLLLCGLVSFSLFGMVPPVIHCDNSGQPIQPSKMEELKANVKTLFFESSLGSYLGLFAGVGFVGGVAIMTSVVKDNKFVSIKSIPINLLVSFAGLGLLFYNEPLWRACRQNLRNNAFQRNFNINETVRKSCCIGSILCGFAAGLYTGIKVNEYFLNRG